MKYEEVMPALRAGREIRNKGWNGSKLDGSIIFLKIQNTDEYSKNTEPYIMMHLGKSVGDGLVFKRFPWTPSALDLFSEL